ncbi:hypothetical protein BDV96DRAFT_658157 [Lophiotrema nucula]|uniref:N-acetyltransferase domain-containing protein n=1 Tax=Lophiotrema nucula TaxID=690887 RepID=A0A6A5ZCF3_9PLEO|nr:hypothetical protein BDV96DRAFT_658157 [Lophiotrema nucula]
MSLKLCFARSEDAARIAEIYMMAFDGNAMVHAQFPTNTALREFQQVIQARTLVDIADVNTTILVVRGTTATNERSNETNDTPETILESETIMGAAKWSHPVEVQDENFKAPHTWSDECSSAALQDWRRVTEKAENEVVGQVPHYELSFLVTHPMHERKGAGSLMLQWGIEQCEKTGRPAYLESTVEATSFYEKFGFQAKATLSFETLKTYKEIGFLYEPKGLSAASDAVR